MQVVGHRQRLSDVRQQGVGKSGSCGWPRTRLRMQRFAILDSVLQWARHGRRKTVPPSCDWVWKSTDPAPRSAVTRSGVGEHLAVGEHHARLFPPRCASEVIGRANAPDASPTMRQTELDRHTGGLRTCASLKRAGRRGSARIVESAGEDSNRACARPRFGAGHRRRRPAPGRRRPSRLPPGRAIRPSSTLAQQFPTSRRPARVLVKPPGTRDSSNKFRVSHAVLTSSERRSVLLDAGASKPHVGADDRLDNRVLAPRCRRIDGPQEQVRTDQ